MKVFLALEVRKSVLIKLAFAKSFGKIDVLDLAESDFLDLAKFDFLDLADFTTVDRFFIIQPILSPPALLLVALAES